MSDDMACVREFFERYASSRTRREVELIASQYANTFMVADPNGPRAATREVVLAVFPAWMERLKTQGHTSTELRSLEMTDLSGDYRLVRAQLVWHFERPEGRIELPVDSTFILCVMGQAPEIVLQLEREDFREILRSRGMSLT